MSIEQDFERFRRDGDSSALARVFDSIAPELLLVASHLAKPPIEGEDLVQATFVQAIRNADRWDGARPLRPWLIGILANEARAETRRRARKVDPDRLDAQESEEPIRTVASQEFADAFAEKLSELPEKYRHILTLRYVHGLQPAEIAHSLGRSPETVKTWLRRGREILKRILPAGFAASLAAVAHGQRTLADVREVVLAEAEFVAAATVVAEAAATATTADATTALWIKAAALVVPAILGLLFLGGAFSGPDPDATPPLRDPEVGSRASDPKRDAAGSRTSSGAEDTRVERVARLRWSDGGPAANVHVRLRPKDRPNARLFERWFVSDDAGHVTLDSLSVGEWSLRIDRAHEVDFAVAEDLSVSLDVEIPPGDQVAGRVVDFHTGRAIGRARIWLSSGARLDEGRVVTVTDGSGRFTLRDVAADRVLCARADAYGGGNLVRARGGDELLLRLGNGDRMIRGVVVDRGGRPIPRASVLLGNVLRDPHDRAAAAIHTAPLRTWTDEDGRFAARGFRPYQRHGIWAAAPGYAMTAMPFPDADDATSSDRVRLVLDRGTRVRGRIRADAARSRGIEVHVASERFRRETRAALRTDGLDVSPPWITTVVEASDSGEYEFVDLPPGRAFAFAHSRDRSAVASRQFDLHADSPRVWNATLVPSPTLSGRVVDTALRPVSGVLVRAQIAPGLPRPPFVSTREDGSFVLRGCLPANYEIAVVHRSEDGSESELSVEAGVRAGASSVQIQVDTASIPSAWITGRVRVDASTVDVGSERLSMRVSTRGFERVGAIEMDSARFRLGPLTSGDYRVALLLGYRVIWERAVTLESGREHDCGDIVPPALGSIRVTGQLADGTPLDRLFGYLVSDDGLSETRKIWFKDGVAEGIKLPPGRYLFAVERKGVWAFRRGIQIRPVAQSRARIEIGASPTVIELTTRSRTMTYRAHVRILDARGHLVGRTDVVRDNRESGVHVLSVQLQPGDYVVEVSEPRRSTRRRSFRVTARGSAARVRVPD